jgi:hypothetical protein
MQHTNWDNLEIKRHWDIIATLAEEQLIYFSMEKQKEVKQSIDIIDRMISKLN